MRPPAGAAHGSAIRNPDCFGRQLPSTSRLGPPTSRIGLPSMPATVRAAEFSLSEQNATKLPSRTCCWALPVLSLLLHQADQIAIWITKEADPELVIRHLGR